MTDRSIVTAWVVLVASLVGLVALFDWAFVHVLGRAASPVIGTGTVGPASGVHGTAAGPDARVAPVLEGSTSMAVSSASAGEIVTESAPLSPAGGDGELAIVEAPGAATGEIGSPTVDGAPVEAAEIVPTGAVGDTSAGAIEGVPVEVSGDRSVEAAGDAAEERADGSVTADASIDDVTAIGETVRDAVPDTDAMDGTANDIAAEGPAGAARRAAATPFPEAAALHDGVEPDGASVDTDRTSIANGTNIDTDAEDDDADAGLEALRRLLAEAVAIEAATEPFGAGTGTSAERTVSGDDTSRRVPAAVADDLAEAIRFEPRSTTFGRDATTVLDELAVLLADRPDLTVTVGVTVDEFGDETRDRVLGRERGRAIIAGLVARGVAFERLSLSAEDGGASSSGSHRVRIVVDTDG